MTAETNVTSQAAEEDTANLPNVHVPTAPMRADFATILGLLLSFSLIVAAIVFAQSDATFFNLPSFLIVILGTMTATSISFTGDELRKSGVIIAQSAVRPHRNLPALATSMLDFAIISRKKGVLMLSKYENEMRNDPFLHSALKLAIDGYALKDIEYILQQEIDTRLERNMRAASMLRRGSEIAPAMGLIGTLVGLVQMLADLKNPETIGPAMALALLTTFYGAILGTVVMAPLAAKLEKHGADEATAQTMALKTTLSILHKENPRNLEMLLNALLPPSLRIRYFE